MVIQSGTADSLCEVEQVDGTEDRESVSVFSLF
jgi:hypothetical protein